MQYINTETPFEQKHFNPNSSTVCSHSIDIKQYYGFPLTDIQIKRLSGAPTGSKIDVVYKQTWSPAELSHENVPPGLYFIVNNPQYISDNNQIGIFHDGSSTKVGVYIKLTTFKKDAPRKIAARMLAIVIREALKLPGITRLKLLAAGGRRWSDIDSMTVQRWGGYVAWPTYGFDMPLLKNTIAISGQFRRYPRNISTCKTVRDVLTMQGGREYWRAVGDGWYMNFDLTSTSSQSIKMLDDVLQKENV